MLYSLCVRGDFGTGGFPQSFVFVLAEKGIIVGVLFGRNSGLSTGFLENKNLKDEIFNPGVILLSMEESSKEGFSF